MIAKEQHKSHYLGLPKVTIEIEEITPEQRKKGEPGTSKAVEGTNSWVQATVVLLMTYLQNAFTVQVRDISNNLRTPMEGRAAKFGTLGTSNISGVQVGTGSTAVDRDDFSLETRILDGNTAGRLVWDAVGALTKTTAITGGYRIAIERSFNNDSGGDITINEVGVRFIFRYVADTVGQALGLRDIISPGHLVVDGGAVIVRYFFDWLS